MVMNKTIEHEVQKILQEFQPYIQAHGGQIEFVDYHHPFVNLKLRGACSHCPISSITLKLGIQKKLRLKFPEVEVVAEEEGE